MRRIVADRQQSAMHLRMQRLHPAIHHFGKAGEVRDVAHLQAGVGDRLGGAAGGDELDAVAAERAREVDQPGLVGNREEGAGDAAEVGHGTLFVMPREAAGHPVNTESDYQVLSYTIAGDYWIARFRGR